MKKLLMAIQLIIMSGAAAANSLDVTGATVTAARVYEVTDDGTHVWIHLNGNKRVGPNPANPANTCELWTDNKGVHSTVLTALVSGKKVDVTYIDRGEGTYWCKVESLSIRAD